MPVIDGVFIERSPLTPAELHVDFLAHNTHVVDQRTLLENAALPHARRLAVLTSQLHGIPPERPIAMLEQTLRIRLQITARFGFTHATGEIHRLRDHDRDLAALAAWQIPDAGRYGQYAARGLAGIAELIIRRAREAARAISDAGTVAVADAAAAGLDTLVAATTATTRTLHLRTLELVGETLNMGRTAGALSLPEPPEFAMRSEQLDRNTCGPCDELHGTVTTVGTPQFYAVLPPSGCLGGGRCRGLMVFGDGPRDVRQPEPIDLAA